jgi:hypothetical protein
MLQAAWNKWGEESFEWRILLECEESQLLVEEDRFIVEMGTMAPVGFNLKSAERQTMSDETRRKMSESKKGEKNNFWGKKHNPETLQTLRDKCGHEMTDEVLDKLSDGLRKKWADPDAAWNSEEYRKGVADRLSDPSHPMHAASQTPEAKRKRSESLKKWHEKVGRNEETRKRIRQAALLREASKTPEQRAEISRKLSEARKRAVERKRIEKESGFLDSSDVEAIVPH